MGNNFWNSISISVLHFCLHIHSFFFFLLPPLPFSPIQAQVRLLLVQLDLGLDKLLTKSSTGLLLFLLFPLRLPFGLGRLPLRRLVVAQLLLERQG